MPSSSPNMPVMDPPNFIDHDLWGSLQPLGVGIYRMDFLRLFTLITIGRHPQTNHFILPGQRISNNHCEILWEDKSVVLTDLSSNGTWINGELVGKGKKRLLRDGNQIAFGSPIAQGTEDYRFTFRTHTTDLREYDRGEMYLHYEIAHELRSGGYGTVSKGMCLVTGEWVAIKVISQVSFTSGFVERRVNMAREVTIMKNLNHPNICELKDHFLHEHDGSLNLVMELVHGGDLHSYMEADMVDDESSAKFIIWQICEALGYMHTLGVTHRDIKPANILLSDDLPPIVKVTDFGLAKVVDDHTMLRTGWGTAPYLAPEVYQYKGYDHLVDSWGVGCILFDMLTSVRPINLPSDDPRRNEKNWDPLIPWPVLTDAEVTENAKEFTWLLLRSEPKERMTMKNAVKHEWIRPRLDAMKNARNELIHDEEEPET
ncbi:kinase-like domain-containing protein [Armillaria novae-zelandiae]|uniref:Kinase-like domain-containing protein n=1 Tax=Armillaria novae-zelandiae TaxID=153914 RepID=A0AA39P0V5_9AGAR|nr:kinase-like domain-containing protein [Armillaria novae-zelandiae]